MEFDTGHQSYSSKISWLEERMVELEDRADFTPDYAVAAALQELRTNLQDFHALYEELEQRNRQLQSAQLALEEERRRYQELFDQAPDGYLVTDLDGTIQQVNCTLTQRLGLSPDLLYGRPVSVLIGPGYWQEFHLQFQRARNAQDETVLQTVLSPGAGSPFPVEITINPARDPQGRITGLHWVVRDIAGRVETEQALRLQGQIMRNLSEGVVAVRDSDGIIVYTNSRFEEMFGYGRAELIGKPITWVNALGEESPEEVSAGITASLREQGEWRGEVRNLSKDGAPFWCEVTASGFEHAEYGKLWIIVQTDITRRKEANEVLAFRGQIIRNLAEGVAVIRDGDATIIYTNPRFDELFGYNEGELLGQHVSVLNYDGEKSPEDLADEIWAVLRADGVWHGEVTNIRKDGTPFWNYAHVSAFEHQRHGKVWVTVHSDITQRKAAEQALQESEAKFRSLVESANLAIVMGDDKGRIVSWNRGAQEIFGYTEEEALGQDSSLFIPRRYQGSRARALQRAAATGNGNPEGQALEFLAHRKDGSEFPVKLSLFGWQMGGSQFFGAIIEDITQRKQAEQYRMRLRELAQKEEERQRLQTMIDTCPVGVMIVNASTRELELVNQEAQRLRGPRCVPGKIIATDKPFNIYRRPDGKRREIADLPVWRALMYGENVLAEEVITEYPDGCTIPTLVNASPVYSTDGKITSVILIIQDMTPLQEVEKLRNEFLGMVSHELRMPLSTIKGAAASGLRGRTGTSPHSDDALLLFQMIEDQVDHVTDLVSNLLDLTRIEAGAFSVSPEPTDLSSILQESIASFCRAHPHSQIDFQVPAYLPAVQVDRRRIIQVLYNLLDNAARFSPPDSPINLEMEYQGSFVTVHVRDRGPGIPQDKLPYLFAKFSSFGENNGKSAPGVGLGLAICQGIVEAHGEHIWADRGPDGTGTAVSFTLPIATELTQPSSQDSHDDERTQAGSSVAVQGLRVLVVDDDQNTLRFLRRLLEGSGYTTILADDPEEVLQAVKLRAPDLVLLDLMLPHSDGLEVMNRIREYSQVPVIFLTARNTRDDMVNALKMGGDDYITKPFSESELLARMEAVLRRKDRGRGVEKISPYQFEGLAVDFDLRRVTVEDEEVSLSATEYKLLSELAKHCGRVLTHGQLLQMVWGQEYSGETDLLRSTVRRLRQKLGDDAQNPHYIFTVPQVGYRMNYPAVFQSISV